MKNLFKSIAMSAAAVVAFSACQQEIDNAQDFDTTAVIVRVHASANALNSDDPETRTYLGTYNNVANTVLWGTKEYMKLAVTAGETTHFATSDEADAEGSPSATFSFSVDPFEGTPVSYTYQGLYPASAAVASNNTNPANYKVNLPATQNATASSYDPSAYIMVAKPEPKTTLATEWLASYRRATALNKVTLKNLPSGVSIKRVTITAPTGKYFAGARHINLSTGESGDIYNGGGRTETVEVKYATPLAGSGEGTWNADIWFTSWDVLVDAGETLTIVAYTTNQKSYTKTIVVPSGKTIKFQEGYLNTLGANMSTCTPEDVTELEEGDYLILANNSGTYYALKAEAEGPRMNFEDYNGSTSSFLGDADLIWTVAKTANGYSIANDGKYLGWSSGNTATLNAAGDSWTATNYEMDITWETDHYKVAVHSDNSRILAKNNGTYGFAFYTGSGYNNLIFVPATVDPRTSVTLSFAETAINKTTANYNEFIGQAATADPDESAITSNISYELTGDNIGSITSEHTVSLNGNTGTATVTASFDGDENYRPASASYTITVSSASGPQYELVSTAAEVVAGDYIITWNNSYYLPSGSTSGKNPAVGTGITVASNKITNTVTPDMVWTFTGNNDNGFTISDGTNILHSINDAQGITITTNSTRKWTVFVDGTYGMLLHGDDGGTRNLAVYNNASWRYYSTGGSYSGTLRLYKLSDARPEAPISWNAAIGTAIMSANGITYDLPELSNESALNVTYASSTEAVATINASGVITALAAGSTTITATYDGSDSNAPYKTTTVSYTLTVTDNRPTCAAPTLNPAAGGVASGTEITISSTTPGATIYYTTGSSEFSAGDWIEYTTPVEVTTACTIKAIATATNYKNSEVASAAYTIATTISTILADNTITSNNTVNYSVSGVTVMAAQGDKNYVIGDATGVMLMYYNAALTVGNQYDITGGVKLYNGVHEFNNPTSVTDGTGTAPAYGTPEVMTVSSLTSYASAPVTKYAVVHMTAPASGYVGSDGTNNINVFDGTGNWSSFYGKEINVTGYLIGFYNNKINIIATSIEEDTTTPTLSVSPTSLSWAATEIDSKTITVTLNGSAAAGDYNYIVTSGTVSDWTISKNNGTLSVAPIAANTSTTDAKSITLRIAHVDDNTVYQDVTCTQTKASSGPGPSIGTVMWSETWQGGTAGETPAAYGQEGTTVYNGGSVTYANGGTSTKLYDDTMATTNLLLAKSSNNGTWTISGIPTGGVTSLTLSFETNNSAKTRYAISTTTSGVSLGALSVSGSASPYTVTATITITGSVSTFNLTFTNSSSSNVRLDNISVVTASN